MFELDKFLREKQQKISEMSVKSLVEKNKSDIRSKSKNYIFCNSRRIHKRTDLASTSYEHTLR